MEHFLRFRKSTYQTPMSENFRLHVHEEYEIYMFLEGDTATVCNRGSKTLNKINLETYVVVEDETFEEEVLQYLKSDIYRFVILQSGLYMI